MRANVEWNAAAAELETLARQVNMQSTCIFINVENALLGITKVLGVLNLAEGVNVVDNHISIH